MKTRHRIVIQTKCPVNGGIDRYVCDVFPAGLLYCEAIEKAATGFSEPLTQEQITQRLANALGCKVRTRGSHGQVETTCTCLPGVEK